MAADNSYGYILNRLFPKGLADATYRDPKTTLLALIRKDPKGGGQGLDIPVQYTAGGGRSHTFATGKSNAGNGPDGIRFKLDYADDYAWAQVTAKNMRAAKTRDGGVVDVLDNAFKTATRKIKRSICRGLAGDGTACVGVIGSIPSSGVLKLADWRDSKNIEVGDVLVSAAAKSTGALDTGSALVTAVDGSKNQGLITVTYQDSFSPTANHYLFIQGDRNLAMKGLAAWLPATAPTSGDSFGGVDRSVAPHALAGIREDVSGESSIRESLLAGMESFRTYNCDTTHIITSPFDFTRLERELEDKKSIVDVPNEYELGIKGIMLEDGSIVVMDPFFAKGYAYPINLETWTLESMDEAPHIADEDGLKMLRMDTADAFEAMIRYWAQVRCDDPSQNGVLILPTLS